MKQAPRVAEAIRHVDSGKQREGVECAQKKLRQNNLEIFATKRIEKHTTKDNMSAAPKKKAAPKKPAAHPMYKEMIAAAIKALASKSGSSKQAISKYIAANYKVGDRHDVNLRRALLAGLASGALVKKTGLGCSGSFKLAKPVAAPKAAPKKKKVAPKKKAAPKKKKATKKKAATKASD